MAANASSLSSSSLLTPTQRYAAGALFGLALHQANVHQTRPLGLSVDDVVEDDQQLDGRSSSGSSGASSSGVDSVSEDPELWVHQNSGLLRPIFRVLDIDSVAWSGLEETAGSPSAHHHVGAFLRLLSEESDNASQTSDQDLALSKAIDAMAHSMETGPAFSKSKREKHREYENECREKLSSAETKPNSDMADLNLELKQERNVDDFGTKVSPKSVTVSTDDMKKLLETASRVAGSNDASSTAVSDTNLEKPLVTDNKAFVDKDPVSESISKIEEKATEEVMMLSYQRKTTALYELLSACLADTHENDKKISRRRKGYDARHRVALHLLATWLDIKFFKVEAIETMVACSAMAIKKEEVKREEAESSESKWAKWKRGGIIGAAALTGGTLMAITGGLAAPAIAAGFGALAPTLGTLIPVIGAGGFAAAASAAGTVAGSVAVAASFGAAGAGLTGTKMARRIGSVDEFEFKAIGENHNQGRLAVEILISGFVFDKEDFIKPWEGLSDNLERYVLQWESKYLIAVSTAIQDWLTSSISMELMKHGAMLTVLSTLVSALAWPATLLSAFNFIDSKWTIAVDRSDKAGKLLADALLKGLQGNRPVTLIGYSLGARVIFKCLQALAEAENSAGLVERVVLLGAPIPIQDENWEAARKVVAGRFINAYSTNDWILGIAFRASLLTKGLAGIQPINVPGIQNVDVTDFIEGHSSYLWATQKILEQLELETYYPVFKSTQPRE